MHYIHLQQLKLFWYYSLSCVLLWCCKKWMFSTKLYFCKILHPFTKMLVFRSDFCMRNKIWNWNRAKAISSNLIIEVNFPSFVHCIYCLNIHEHHKRSTHEFYKIPILYIFWTQYNPVQFHQIGINFLYPDAPWSYTIARTFLYWQFESSL